MLHADSLAHIFSFLDQKELRTAALTSRLWHKTSQRPYVWRAALSVLDTFAFPLRLRLAKPLHVRPLDERSHVLEHAGRLHNNLKLGSRLQGCVGSAGSLPGYTSPDYTEQTAVKRLMTKAATFVQTCCQDDTDGAHYWLLVCLPEQPGVDRIEVLSDLMCACAREGVTQIAAYTDPNDERSRKRLHKAPFWRATRSWTRLTHSTFGRFTRRKRYCREVVVTDNPMAVRSTPWLPHRARVVVVVWQGSPHSMPGEIPFVPGLPILWEPALGQPLEG